MKVPLSSIKTNPYNTREDLGDLTGLRASIRKTDGLIQPLIVRSTGRANTYQIVFGGRRLQALKDEGYKTTEVTSRKMSNEDMATLALCENVHRKDLNPVELARAYRRGLDATKLSVNAFTKVTGESHVKISSYLNILELPDRILKRQANYTTTQLIALGKLNKLAPSARIMLENALSQRDISSQCLRQIALASESIHTANLPDRTKKSLFGEVILQDYSHLLPESAKDIKTFSDTLLGKAITDHNVRAGRIKTKTTSGKRIKKVADISNPNRELNEVTDMLRKATTHVYRAKKRDYYENASRRNQGKFRTAVNKLLTGLELVIKNE